tara:strand:- start:886 stop:1044 length:159 start_codon:yes stop_codon:yes gene_type:complete
MSKTAYASIGVLQETKKKLDSLLLKKQSKLGIRLTYDDMLKTLMKGDKKQCQ